MYKDKTNSLYLHFLRSLLFEIKAVNKNFHLETGDSLAVFRALNRLYMSTMRHIIKPSVFRMNNEKQLRELDLNSPSVYLSPADADLGTTFSQKLGASTLPPEMKLLIQTRCTDFMKQLLVQYQMRLPASMELLAKLELLCPAAVMSYKLTVRELPRELFSGSLDSLETKLRNVASAGFSPNIDAFWLEVESFKDAGGNHCFQDLAFGAIKLLTLPISNASVERAFSQVTPLKDDLRSRMGLLLLSGLMDVRTGLARNGLTSATFRPPRQLLRKFDCSIY